MAVRTAEMMTGSFIVCLVRCDYRRFSTGLHYPVSGASPSVGRPALPVRELVDCGRLVPPENESRLVRQDKRGDYGRGCRSAILANESRLALNLTGSKLSIESRQSLIRATSSEMPA